MPRRSVRTFEARADQSHEPELSVLPQSQNLMRASIANGLDPDWPKDATTDLDGDRTLNVSEFIAGTDPSDSEDRFEISSLVRQDRTATVTWPSVAGRNYEIFWSTDLEVWTAIGSSLLGSGADRSRTIDLDGVDAFDCALGNLTRIFVRLEVSVAE